MPEPSALILSCLGLVGIILIEKGKSGKAALAIKVTGISRNELAPGLWKPEYVPSFS
ncbi:hypothetical protein [Marinobacter subterrani]|uniref:hypothetical protein n=1 Tax=Marinobacter subterrani TaxID=1658765 RepID=UPI003B5993F8